MTLWSRKVTKEDNVGAGPQKMAVNLSLIEQYACKYLFPLLLLFLEMTLNLAVTEDIDRFQPIKSAESTSACLPFLCQFCLPVNKTLITLCTCPARAEQTGISSSWRRARSVAQNQVRTVAF